MIAARGKDVCEGHVEHGCAEAVVTAGVIVASGVEVGDVTADTKPVCGMIEQSTTAWEEVRVECHDRDGGGGHRRG